MTHPTDALTDDLGRSLRTTVQVAMLAGEAMARIRENRLRQAEQRSAEHGRAARVRMKAERASAEALLRPVHSDRWWFAATPEAVAATYRTAHAWKEDSLLAGNVLARLDEQILARYGIDPAALSADSADVADRLVEVMNERTERADAAQTLTERGFTVLDDRPAGRGFVPTWDLRTATGQSVEREVIDAAPEQWAVFLTRDDDNQWQPEFFCTDVDGAGLTRPTPPLYLAHEDWWWEMAAEHQIAEIYEQFVQAGAAYGIAHMEDQISRQYGVDARPLRGLPDELADRIGIVTADREHHLNVRERADTAAAIARAESIDAASQVASAHKGAADRGAEPTIHNDRTTEGAVRPDHTPRDDEFSAAVDWAKQAVPRDAERFLYSTGDRKEAARETITTGWEVVQSKAWAAENAPALAAQFSQSEASSDRPHYLAARTDLIHEWTAAGRPRADAALGSSPSDTAGRRWRYDSAERRDALAATLEAAGVDPDAVAARLAADRDNAHPIGALGVGAAAPLPTASKGDRSNTREAATERGDR